jgi:hypothetical protein
MIDEAKQQPISVLVYVCSLDDGTKQYRNGFLPFLAANRRPQASDTLFALFSPFSDSCGIRYTEKVLQGLD